MFTHDYSNAIICTGCTNDWIRPLRMMGAVKNLSQAAANYMKYLKKHVPLSSQHGVLPTEQEPLPRSRTSDVILEMVKKGERMSVIVPQHPTQYNVVAKMMQYRLRRIIKTKILYLYGPTGVGKTTMIWRCLSTLQNLGIVDYFSKGGGLKRFWDGYDNQPICWIDDPVSPQPQRNNEDVQQLKNVMSTGDCLVEIKYGSMVFDS